MSAAAPTVSIFMATYNHEALVREAIDSVLAQDFKDYELIIGDDCSSDATWSIVEDYQHSHPQHIKAFRNDTNLGPAGNFSKILRKCQGKYVAFHAGDDVWLPDKLSAQVALMEAKANCALSYHDLEVFDSASDTTMYLWNSGPRRPAPVTGPAERVAQQIVEDFAGFLGSLAVMIRRSCLDAELDFDPRLGGQGEVLVWMHALTTPGTTVEYIPRVLARYRKHPEGLSQQANRTQEDFFLAIVENEMPGFTNAVRRARGKSYYRRGVECLLAGEPDEAFEYLRQSLRYHPPTVKILYWLTISLWRKITGSQQG